ncbi:MAG: serine hydrolase domain-containing protein [Phyllobacterium sp.]
MSDTFPVFEPGTLAARIDPFFKEWNSAPSPGVLVAVLSGGKVVHEAAYGMADLANEVPLTPHSVVRIASQSKQFTTCLLLMLERDGLLSLQDDVRDHLSWLPDFGYKVTLRHLASNTSGLRDILEMMTIGGVPILAPSSRIYARNVVARQSVLNFEPGSDLLYSNSNFLLLSEILETVSGKTFDELLHERITGPLGMHDTRLMPRDDVILPRLAVHHRRGPDGNWLKAAWGIAIGGEGGMVSTLHDMILWQQNLRDPKVGDPALYASMENPSILINGEESPYGYGLVRDTRHPVEAVGHGGWIAGSRSESLRYKEADLGIIILSNHDEFAPYVLARTIARDLLGFDMQPTEPAFDLAEGFYRDEAGDDAFQIELRDGRPHLVMNMGSSPLVSVGNDRWQPQSSIPPFTLNTGENGSLKAERFGRSRHFIPIRPEQIDLGLFANRAFYSRSGEFSGETCEVGNELQLTLTSPEGMQRVRLVAYGQNYFFAHPVCKQVHDQWRLCPWVLPWLFTVRFSDEGLIINSDRTKRLVLSETKA